MSVWVILGIILGSLATMTGISFCCAQYFDEPDEFEAVIL